MTQQNRPEIKVRATRPSDGILYERNEFIAYWLEEGDLENFLDHPPDSINGCCGNTEQEALEAAQKHWTIREENHRRNREKFIINTDTTLSRKKPLSKIRGFFTKT